MRARRVDANHTEIAEEFERLDCSVHRTIGDWDLTVGIGGITILVEVKDGSKPPSARKLTKREQKFHATWKGGIRLIKSKDEVQEVVKTMLSDLEAIKKARLLNA